MSTPDLRAQRPLPAEAQSPSKLRLVLVTSEPLFREGLQSACRGARSLLLVETTTTVSDAIALATSRLVDLVVIEATSLQQAIKMTQAVQAARVSEIPVVAVTGTASANDVKSALDAGFRGCVLKRVEVSELLGILENIGQGSLYLPPEFAARQRMRFDGGARDQSRLCRLTPREAQILGCVARALTNREVARELQLSEKTVKHYMTVIMQKLQVRNRIEAVLKAKPLIDD
jgi:two-component system, NarL family, nitrate/nitrite response regulator NarL